MTKRNHSCLAVAVLALMGTAAAKGEEPQASTEAPRAAQAQSAGPAAPEAPAPSRDVLPFGQGMTRPALISGTFPRYSPAATAKGVTGRMQVKCVVLWTGRVNECRVLKSLHFRRAVAEAMELQEGALAFLEESRFKPATFNGRPVSVSYLFSLEFKPPTGPEDAAFVIRD